MHHDRIAVVDFGGQYAHLIATKVRRLHVLAEIVDPLAPLETFESYQGIILSGSPALSAHGEGEEYTREIYDLDIPILGLCFGHQVIAKRYGGRVEHTQREYGPATLRIVADSPLFAGLDREQVVWMSHGDSVTQLPPGFVELGYSMPAGAADSAGPQEGHRNSAIASERLKRYGFQFHPEVDDTEHGQEMLANFVLRICACRPTWTVTHYVDDQKSAIRERAGKKSVFLLASGGVDSTVTARLLVEALGSARVHMLHIDNGLMRKNESHQVVERFRGWGITANLHFVDASERFLTALAGLVEPEEKRLAIGNTFIEVCEREMERLGVGAALLAQGTIYPDTIETGGTQRADVIKTHHNRVPMVAEMVKAGRVLEPVRELYKVEVRELGAALGIEADFLERHPFPGPGLGVRLLCSRGRPVGTGAEETVAELERIGRESAAIAVRFGMGAAVLPIRSVGVKADLRAYEWPVFLFSQAGKRQSWDGILEAANHIYKEVAGVNRCVYDLSAPGGGPGGFGPGSASVPELELLAAHVTRERLDLLREADALVMDGLARHGLMRTIWQCPTVLLPIRVRGRGCELVVVRPVHSERAMTARPACLPEVLVGELRAGILALPGVSGLAIDVTTKPPGTIEWE
jgi:GMP synthase (glutamine-hydrolysing)